MSFSLAVYFRTSRPFIPQRTRAALRVPRHLVRRQDRGALQRASANDRDAMCHCGIYSFNSSTYNSSKSDRLKKTIEDVHSLKQYLIYDFLGICNALTSSIHFN